MYIKRKLTVSLAALIMGFGVILPISSSYAGFNPFQPVNDAFDTMNHVINAQMNLAKFALGALVVGSIVHAIAVSSQRRVCQRVYYTHSCGVNQNGQHVCYSVKHVVRGC